MINKADALGKILACMEDKFGDIRIAPLYAREGMSASRIVIQGIKGSRAPLQLLPGLILHEDDNIYSADAEAVLRDGVAWRLR
jgi:tRNA1(Val) A37 N6-methylase TrmN6